MRAIFATAILLTIGITAAARCVHAADSIRDRPRALRIQIRHEPITPVTALFIERALKEAEQSRPKIIELHTPGGLLESTQQIVKQNLAGRIPVVVYVSPTGGSAASAGLFITVSSHVAAKSGRRAGSFLGKRETKWTSLVQAN